MSEKTTGELACVAWNEHYAGQYGIEARNEWAASDPRGRAAWEAAANAAQQPLRDQFAALATQMHAEADAARYAIEAAALHECASRIRLAIGPDATREAPEGK